MGCPNQVRKDTRGKKRKAEIAMGGDEMGDIS